jgi:hypothetical protein
VLLAVTKSQRQKAEVLIEAQQNCSLIARLRALHHLTTHTQYVKSAGQLNTLDNVWPSKHMVECSSVSEGPTKYRVVSRTVFLPIGPRKHGTIIGIRPHKYIKHAWLHISRRTMPSEKMPAGTKIVEYTLLLNSVELSSTSIGLHLLMEAGCEGIDCNRQEDRVEIFKTTHSGT